jgi:hypothetical protein
MPFVNREPRPFDSRAVESLIPHQHGCYAIFAGDRCVYVGHGDIRSRMLSHLAGDNQCIAMNRPTHWFAIVTPDPTALEDTLVRELRPLCNRRVG